MMEKTTTEKKQLKFKIRLKQDGSVGNSSMTADQLNNVEGAGNASNSSNLTGSHAASSQDRVDFSTCAEGVANHRRSENEGNPSSQNSEYQLMVYNPAVNGAGSTENAPDPIGYEPAPLPRQHQIPNKTRRVMLSAEIFTVQCSECFKWRLIPTKEKYEEIREHITEQPFLCETAREWRPDVSCDDPPDITQDGSKIWAMDKPNIAQPPPGWQRLLRIRAEGGTKFADVYYIAPSGNRLRSMQEIKRYLEEQPQYQAEGVSFSKFSFQIPRPLQENYVRKRHAPAPAPANDPTALEMPLEANPQSRASPDMLQLSRRLGLFSDSSEAGGSNPKRSTIKTKKEITT